MCSSDKTKTTTTNTTKQQQEERTALVVNDVESNVFNSGNIRTNTCSNDDNEAPVSNEYVLNVAFVSFLGFTTLQLFFAIIARSQSMMADCAAMYVDVVTYLFNFMAERLKHGRSDMSVRDLKLHRLYLELVPPFISVVTLVVVTIMALRQAIETLVANSNAQGNGGGGGSGIAKGPDVFLMLLFSGLNLLLDFVNVSYFARADQAVGLPGQHGYEDIHVQHSRQQHEEKGNHAGHRDTPPVVLTSAMHVTEDTPLLVAAAHGNGNGSGNGNVIHDGAGISNGVERRQEMYTREESTTSHNDEKSHESEMEKGGLNLNMCSAWTHICADTLRSIAVLIAAGVSYLFPSVLSPSDADSYGAIVVSVIILVSLAPLFQGLYGTVCRIRAVYDEPKDDGDGIHAPDHIDGKKQKSKNGVATANRNSQGGVAIAV